MRTPIARVRDHIPSFLDLDDAAFAVREEHLKRQLACSNPVAVLTRRTIGGALEALKVALDRDALLHLGEGQEPARVAREVLAELCAWLPPVDGRITCHLVPNGGERGSGNCFGRDRLLVTVPCRGDVVSWVRFVAAHEYSHTLRGFQSMEDESVRDFLVFEGLAMVLAEVMCPEVGRLFQDEEPDEVVERFWAEVDLDAIGHEAYMREMARPGAYEAGARIVRSYVDRRGVSIAEAHTLDNETLYSGN